MKIKDQAMKELDTLRPSDLLMVYDLMLSLKEKVQERAVRSPLPAYKRVREALKGCKGSLSEDIMREREDRI